MARQVRIAFAGAIYHCMARGDRREPIVKDDADRNAFVDHLDALEERTGFEFYSWVLTPRPRGYHLVFKTPEPNLVEGMKWLQNTWTKRFNARHRLWGHVFGGKRPTNPMRIWWKIGAGCDYAAAGISSEA